MTKIVTEMITIITGNAATAVTINTITTTMTKIITEIITKISGNNATADTITTDAKIECFYFTPSR